MRGKRNIFIFRKRSLYDDQDQVEDIFVCVEKCLRPLSFGVFFSFITKIYSF